MLLGGNEDLSCHTSSSAFPSCICCNTYIPPANMLKDCFFNISSDVRLYVLDLYLHLEVLIFIAFNCTLPQAHTKNSPHPHVNFCYNARTIQLKYKCTQPVLHGTTRLTPKWGVAKVKLWMSQLFVYVWRMAGLHIPKRAYFGICTCMYIHIIWWQSHCISPQGYLPIIHRM